jgi:hypothetical protein
MPDRGSVGGELVMSISRVAYCNRLEVQRAVDFKDGTLTSAQIDRALQSAAEVIEGHLHRVYYPYDATKYFDWPNYQSAAPWRFWLDQHDVLALTSLSSPSGTAIPLSRVFLEPVNNAGRLPPMPYTRIELDRSTAAAWGAGPTPQHSIVATGTWGFGADTDPGGALAASCLAGDTTLTVTDSSVIGVGDLIIIGYGRGAAPFPAYPGTAGAVQPYTGERVIISGQAMTATGLTVSGSGCTTVSAADNILATSGAGTLNTGEAVQVDGEQMLLTGTTSGGFTVQRAWNGSVLASHSTGAGISAPRLLTVLRGQLGTTAAGWSNATAVSRHRPPGVIRDLAIAETVNRVLQETSGYAREVGEGENARPAPGMSLADLWDEAETVRGRKNRQRVI